ncbi:MAG: DUF5615 family PIN-like protein [Aestuariivirga sp.]
MTPSFVVDEQLPPALAEHLRQAGYEAVHVYDQGLGGGLDETVAEAASKRKSILITKDADFVVRSNLEKLKVPVIWVRLGNVTNAILWKRLALKLPEILKEIRDGAKVVEVQ